MNESKLANRINSIVVSLYKAMGFAILAIILGGLISYLGVQAFFLVSSSWAAPTIISPSDEKILDLNAQMAQQLANREKLIAERSGLKSEILHADRVITAEKAFEDKFRNAITSDRADRARELSRLVALAKERDDARGEIASSNKAYSGLSRTRAETLKGVALIDQESFLTTNYQLAQLANANLTLAEREVDIDSRVGRLRQEIRALDGINSGNTTAAVSTDVLMLQQDFTKSSLELAKAEQEKIDLVGNIESLDRSIARYDELLKAIKNSPYIKALEGNLTVAFVPYANLGHATPGAALYGCEIGLLWCKPVGKVVSTLEGEVQLKHPIRNVILRGSMVEVELTDPAWARKELLHLGGAPLFF